MQRRRGLAIATAVAAVLGVLVLTPSARAVVPDSPWAGLGTTSHRVVSDGSAGPAIFAYDNFAPPAGGAGAEGSWEFSASSFNEIPTTVFLDYVYTGFHGDVGADVEFEAFVTDPWSEIEPTTVHPLEPCTDGCPDPSGGFSFTGTVELSVPGGASYGFRMRGSNADENARLRGRLIVDDADGDIQSDTLVINGWNGSRVDSGWGITEPKLTGTRGHLDDPAAFGGAGVVGTDYLVADGVGVVDAEALMGTDVFFTGWVRTETITAAEKAALVDFVEAGGMLIATTDDPGHTMVDAFGLVQGSTNTNPSTFVASDHPIADGPFGQQLTFDEYATQGSYTSLGSSAIAVATNSEAPPKVTMAEIVRDALAPGSGLALFVADVDFFSDVYGGSTDNEIAIKNLFAYLADRPPSETDEPGTVQLVQAIPVGSETTTSEEAGGGGGGGGELELVTPESEETTYYTYVVFLADGPAGATQDLEVLFAETCVDGSFGAPPAFLGEAPVTFDADTGRAAFAGVIASEVELPPDAFAAARFRTEAGALGAVSDCILSGPDNDSWTRALELDARSGPAETTGALTGPGNARWFKFDVIPGARVEVQLDGLPADYDLALFKDIRQTFEALEASVDDVDDLHQLSAEFAPSAFAPSAFAPSAFAPSAFAPSAFAPSAFAPSAFAPSAFAPSAFAPSAFAPSAFAPSAFAAENFASAQTTSLLAVSAQFGTGGEAVVADTWNNTGEFYVRVAGKNGAFDPENAFDLRITMDGEQCADVAPISAAAFTAPSGGHRTIIITDNDRIDPGLDGNDAAARAALDANLAAYAARDEVQGIVVDLGEFPHVAALHAQADANPSCPYAENLTAEAIRDIVVAHRLANPALEFVTLVGSDTQVPYFRYPDQALLGPEQDYEPPVANGTQSQSALRLNYVLGQDEYGADKRLSLQDSVFPLPDLAVGRLVETAADMNTVLEAYLGTIDGIVTPDSSLVTGYDFLTDAAERVQEELVAGLGAGASRNDTLITPADKSPQDPASWTAEQLRSELLDEGEDLIFLAGHFSANSALAADFTTELLATELAASATDLTNAVVFSNGCHSGYNIANDDAIPGVTEQVDWTQAFARQGATLIAGTGYQYGDTDFIEYSERIYTQFARELRRGDPGDAVAVGNALVRAKQEYLATTPELEGLHRKSLLISALYGLPNLRVLMAGERIPDPPTGGGGALTRVTTDPGSTLELDTTSVSLDLTSALTERIVPLADIENGTTVNASYLEGPDGVLTNLGRPALPLVSQDVTQPGTALRGVGFRGGAWSEEVIDAPLTGAPATEIRGVHTPFASVVNFPMKLTSVNYFGAITGTGGTRLNVTPAQHRVEAIGDIQTIRRTFANLELDLFYSANTQVYGANQPALAAPPSITGVRAEVVGDDLVFHARVVGNLSAGIQQVWVTHTDGSGVSSGTWLPVDLTQDPDNSTVWSGTLADGAVDFSIVDYAVHAVNGVGLVTTDDNFGAYYQVAGAGYTPPVDDPSPTAITLDVPSTVQFGTRATASALLTSEGAPLAGRRVLFSGGSTSRVTTTGPDGRASVSLPITSPPGPLALTASFTGTDDLVPSTASTTISIVKAPSQLALSTVPPIVGPGGVATGQRADLSANGAALIRRTVYFTLVDETGAVRTFPRTTDNVGRAHLGTLSLAPGSYEVTARFLGSIPTPSGTPFLVDDPSYLASTTATAVLEVNAPPTVEAPGTLTVDEGESATIAAAASDPDGDALTFTWAGGDAAIATLAPTSALTPQVTGVDDGTTSYTLTASDGELVSEPAVTTIFVNNVAPVIHRLELDTDAAEVGTVVTAQLDATDVGTADVLEVLVDWGDGSETRLTGQARLLSTAIAHTYDRADIRTVTVTVCDDDGGCDEAASSALAVWDPRAGRVHGSGKIESPPDASVAHPSASGDAKFTFDARYQLDKKSGAYELGKKAKFDLQEADLRFRSTTLDWLVVAADGLSWFKGAGTSGDGESMAFLVTARDGVDDGFRMQIWDPASGEVVYDSQPGAPRFSRDVQRLRNGTVHVHEDKPQKQTRK